MSLPSGQDRPVARPVPDLFGDVGEFHAKFGLPVHGEISPRELPGDIGVFRFKFMYEELTEYDCAVAEGDLAKQLDALVDLVYVALGTAHFHGFDFNEAWRRVQAANMAKIRCERPGDSLRGSTWDVIKPPGWQPADLSDLV